MHPISKTLRDQTDPKVTFGQIRNNVDAHVGKKVVWGGTIVETRNLESGTEVEVVQHKLDSFGYPESGDQTAGRFIFKYREFLEPEIYSNERHVTGAGTVIGTKSGKVGETNYEFPVVEVEELHLWEKRYPDWGYPYSNFGFFWGYPGYYGPYYGRFGRSYYFW